MTSPSELLPEIQAALGLENVSILTQGGQKLVLKATLAGAPAIGKVVFLPVGPEASIVLERSHREVELLAAVDSPTVVRVLTDAVEIGDRPDAVCWVEECLEGEDLASHLARPWDEEEVWQLLSDMALALQACHLLDVVHRDLSARNVRRLPNGAFVLMDPGLARHLAKAALTGVFQPGTPGWRSPEHVPGGEPVPASDIFALGILAFYALTQRFPIDPHVSEADYNRALLETQAVSVGTLRTDVSDELVRVIDNCLKRQPARRYIDGGELVEFLNSIGRSRS